MAQQRDIIMVSYELPQGVEYHPVIIISGDAIFETEGIYYAVMCSGEIMPDEFAIELTPDMIVGRKAMSKKTFVKTHLIQAYTSRELKTHIGSVTLDAFNKIKLKVSESIFS